LSTIYYPAADPGDHEHSIVKHTTDIHNKYGTHPGNLEVGTPGNDKYDWVYRPVMHLLLPDEGKVIADVVWAKIWFYVYATAGDPTAIVYSLQRCTKYDWHDYYTHGLSASLDYTCYQHSGGAWTNPFGDFTTPTVDFSPAENGNWFSVPITDFVTEALDPLCGHVRDLNIGIWSPETANVSWLFNCKHAWGIDPKPWYVEVEWAAAVARGYAQVI
jgi:hypothetical protein